MHLTRTSLCVAIVSGIAACAGGPAERALLTERVDKSLKTAEQRLAERATPPSDNLVTYREESWMGLRKVSKVERDPGKARIDAIEIEINQTFSSLNDIAGILTSMTGTPVYIDSDVLSAGGAVGNAGSPSGALAQRASVAARNAATSRLR
jgi:hypothetical protein